jgi:hypothetical protein
MLCIVAFLGTSSCASKSGFVHYALDPLHDTLRAHDPKKDLPLRQTCAGDEQVKVRCVAMMIDEFYKMETELIEIRQALKDCQKGPKP